MALQRCYGNQEKVESHIFQEYVIQRLAEHLFTYTNTQPAGDFSDFSVVNGKRINFPMYVKCSPPQYGYTCLTCSCLLLQLSGAARHHQSLTAVIWEDQSQNPHRSCCRAFSTFCIWHRTLQKIFVCVIQQIHFYQWPGFQRKK